MRDYTRWRPCPPVFSTKTIYATASLAAFTGRPLITLRAGLALKTVGSFVKGLMPLRSLVAGFLTTAVCADIQHFRVRNFDDLNIVELFAGEPRLVMLP